MSEEIVALRRRVAELEKLEDQHRHAEELLAVLATFPKQNPNPVIETDLSGRIRYLNPAARERFPELEDGSVDHPMLTGLGAIIRGFEQGEADTFIRDLEVSGSTYQQRIVHLEETDIVRIFANDITDLKRTEEKLVRLASFPEQNPDPVIESDLDGNLTYMNPIALERFPDLVSKGFDHPLLDGLKPSIPTLVAGKELSVVRERNVRGIIYNQKILYMPDSRLLRIYNNDITALKELQNQIQEHLEELEQTNKNLEEAQVQLVQSEKMAALGKLVAGIAHEINTPIGAIYSAHDTLKRAKEKLPGILSKEGADVAAKSRGVTSILQVMEDVGSVVRSGSERVMSIVQSMKSFARLDEAELKQVDIHEGLDDTLNLIQHDLEGRISVIKDYGAVPPIVCYPGRLNQAFLSLLVNATQAIEGSGEIAVSTSKQGESLRVSISDTGGGIPPENLERVFEPGFTTKGVGVGTGLGLSICYQVFKEHGGEISIESEIGKGTRATCTLPYSGRTSKGATPA